VGATINYAPPAQNLFTQYYEVRAYDFGPLVNRPSDLATLTATRNVYSPVGLSALTQAGLGHFRETTSIIGSYAFHLAEGVFVQPGLGVTVHPIYSPRFDTALNGYLTISLFL